MIAQACASCGVERFVHISALGIDGAKSRYAQTKRSGEEAVLNAFPSATILRPSVVFGPEDNFFNMFAALAQFLPALPLIGGGKTRFQPVYVGDVATAALCALQLPTIGEQNPQGRIYALGGPEIVSFKEIYKRLFEWTGRERALIALPFWVARIGAFLLQMLPPRPLLTPDQVRSLETDSIVPQGAAGLEDLGIIPTGMTLIVPGYLERFRSGGRFSATKAA
jgi:NADH dehydrogenase